MKNYYELNGYKIDMGKVKRQRSYTKNKMDKMSDESLYVNFVNNLGWNENKNSLMKPNEYSYTILKYMETYRKSSKYLIECYRTLKYRDITEYERLILSPRPEGFEIQYRSYA